VVAPKVLPDRKSMASLPVEDAEPLWLMIRPRLLMVALVPGRLASASAAWITPLAALLITV
jgi:hypothetical protein